MLNNYYLLIIIYNLALQWLHDTLQILFNLFVTFTNHYYYYVLFMIFSYLIDTNR